ncbi:MAG: hypothetical protein ABFQ65_00690 [Nanoarchaeota archaeon]
MKKRNIYISIIIVVVLIIIYFFIPKSPEIQECQIDSDCVPVSCCHPDSCVAKEQKPNCEGVLCSMSCESLLDCGAGSCGCKENKCIIISSNE